MIRKITSGEVVELSCFKVGNATKPRSKRNKGSSSFRKQDENDRDAVKRLARTINCNYGREDYWLTLHYDKKRMDRLLKKLEEMEMEATPDNLRDAAVSELGRCLRRVKKDMDADKTAFRYIKATADINGDTGEYVRPHHHLVVNKEAYDYIVKYWPKQEFDCKPLRDQKDYTPMAIYIIRQVRRQPDVKKFSPSRNLKKPEIEETVVNVRKMMKAPSGATVMESTYDAEKPVQYMRYIKPEKKKKRGGKRE
jgi:hypothetical protein